MIFCRVPYLLLTNVDPTKATLCVQFNLWDISWTRKSKMKFTIFKVFFFGVFLSEVLGTKNLRDNTTSLLKKCPENQCLVREIREFLNVMYRLKSRKWFSLVSYRSSRTSCNAQIMLPKIKSECESNLLRTINPDFSSNTKREKHIWIFISKRFNQLDEFVFLLWTVMQWIFAPKKFNIMLHFFVCHHKEEYHAKWRILGRSLPFPN